MVAAERVNAVAETIAATVAPAGTLVPLTPIPTLRFVRALMLSAVTFTVLAAVPVALSVPNSPA